MVFKVFGRIIGGFFKAIGRGFMGFFRWIGRHEAFLGIATVVIVAVFGIWLLLTALNINIVIGNPPAAPAQVLSTDTSATPTPSVAPQPTPLPVSHNNAPAATEAFMTGQINGNADAVWNSLAANLHNQLAGAGRDKTYFEQVFANNRKNGLVYQSYQYVGGVNNDNGTSIQFYVLTVMNSDKQVSRIPWTFILDKDGKIAVTDFPN